MGDSTETVDLLRRAADGDRDAVAELFARHRDRLAQMIRLRLDRRLQSRIDPSDVLQETYLEAAGRVEELARAPTTSVYVWLRALKHLKEILSAVPGLGVRRPGRP